MADGMDEYVSYVVKSETVSTSQKLDMNILVQKIESLETKIDGLHSLLLCAIDELHKLRKPEKKSPVSLKPILPEKSFVNLEEFLAFEAQISADEDKFNQLVRQFSQPNALNSERFIKLCWRQLLNDECAQRFCWKGSSVKEAARILSVTAALRVAYETKYPNGSQTEFERTSILFFQQARNRLKKKALYTSFKQEQIVNE